MLYLIFEHIPINKRQRQLFDFVIFIIYPDLKSNNHDAYSKQSG